MSAKRLHRLGGQSPTNNDQHTRVLGQKATCTRWRLPIPRYSRCPQVRSQRDVSTRPLGDWCRYRRKPSADTDLKPPLFHVRLRLRALDFSQDHIASQTCRVLGSSSVAAFKYSDSLSVDSGENLRAVRRHDELNTGKGLNQRRDDLLLPLRMQMKVNLINNHDTWGQCHKFLPAKGGFARAIRLAISITSAATTLVPLDSQLSGSVSPSWRVRVNSRAMGFHLGLPHPVLLNTFVQAPSIASNCARAASGGRSPKATAFVICAEETSRKADRVVVSSLEFEGRLVGAEPRRF